MEVYTHPKAKYIPKWLLSFQDGPGAKSKGKILESSKYRSPEFG